MDKLLYQIKVKGRVQGVWFRKYTFQKAQDLGLKGFVENDLDGSVSIEAEGDLKQLDQFINWLYRGSPLSKVSSVDYEKRAIENYNAFEVRS